MALLALNLEFFIPGITQFADSKFKFPVCSDLLKQKDYLFDYAYVQKCFPKYMNM